MNAVMIRMFLSCLVTSGFAVIARADEKLRRTLSLATFVADVTPPVGHPLQAGVGVKPVAVVADPLFAHGFVLFGAGETIVLCSVDWCGIGNDAHDRWREALQRRHDARARPCLRDSSTRCAVGRPGSGATYCGTEARPSLARFQVSRRGGAFRRGGGEGIAERGSAGSAPIRS